MCLNNYVCTTSDHCKLREEPWLDLYVARKQCNAFPICDLLLFNRYHQIVYM